MNFGLVQYGGVYIGQIRTKTIYEGIEKIIRILELENAGNADSVAVSVNIFQELSHCTPCILAHFENAKVSKMPRGNIEITQIPHTLIP